MTLPPMPIPKKLSPNPERREALDSEPRPLYIPGSSCGGRSRTKVIKQVEPNELSCLGNNWTGPA